MTEPPVISLLSPWEHILAPNRSQVRFFSGVQEEQENKDSLEEEEKVFEKEEDDDGEGYNPEHDASFSDKETFLLKNSKIK